MTIATTHIWTLLVCLLFFISGITSCDSSDLDKLPVNENPEVAFVNDDVPQRLSLNNARLKRMISPATPLIPARFTNIMTRVNYPGFLTACLKGKQLPILSVTMFINIT